MLGITERHVRRLVFERKIPFAKVGGSSASIPGTSSSGSNNQGADQLRLNVINDIRPTRGKGVTHEQADVRVVPPASLGPMASELLVRRADVSWGPTTLPHQGGRRRLAVIDRVRHPDREPGSTPEAERYPSPSGASGTSKAPPTNGPPPWPGTAPSPGFICCRPSAQRR